MKSKNDALMILNFFFKPNHDSNKKNKKKSNHHINIKIIFLNIIEEHVRHFLISSPIREKKYNIM